MELKEFIKKYYNDDLSLFAKDNKVSRQYMQRFIDQERTIDLSTGVINSGVEQSRSFDCIKWEL